MLAGCIDEVELEVGEAVEVRGEDQILATGMEIGGPAHRTELRKRLWIAAIDVHGPDLGHIALRREATPADALAVGAEKRPAVVAGHVGEAFHVRAIGIGRVDLHEILFVDLEALLVLFAELRFVSLAIAGKDHLLAIGRPTAFGIIATGVGEVFELLVGERVFPDLVVLVVVPGVFADFGSLPLLILGLLKLLRVRVGVRAGEEHAFAVRMNPRTGRLAHAG